MIKCVNCGNSSRDTDIYCRNCGVKIRGSWYYIMISILRYVLIIALVIVVLLFIVSYFVY